MNGEEPRLLYRAVRAVVVLPGVFAGAVPAALVHLDPWRGTGTVFGVLPILIGLTILICCVRDFILRGRGTLSPWDPPRGLVIVGLYRYTRNPMYVGLLVLLTGWVALTASPLLAGYSAILAIGFHVRVVVNEEHWLAAKFGDQWTAYAANTPRWLWPRR